MGMCGNQDLNQEEFDALEKANLYGYAMDSQMLGIIKRFPESFFFHIGMIPDMRTNFAEADVDVEAQEHIEVEHAKWQAELRLFKGNLVLDQKLIKNMEFGSRAFHDIFEWNDGEQVRQQCLIGKHLVKQFMER